MATGVVSGGVALLLNAQPSMTPAQVKFALQTGARFMPDGGPDRRRRGQRELRAVAEDRDDRVWSTSLLSTGHVAARRCRAARRSATTAR